MSNVSIVRGNQMFRDSLQKKLQEMEKKNPSPSLKNNTATMKDHLQFLYRYLKCSVRKKSDYHDFERARGDETYRQEFVDGIDLENYEKFIRNKIYKIRHSFLNRIFSHPLGKKNMETRPGNGIFQRRGSTIYIYPPAFSQEYFPTLEDFISTLVDHEGFHAQEYYQQGSSLIRDFVAVFFSQKKYCTNVLLSEFIREVNAYRNQLQKASERGISEQQRLKVEQKLQFYQDLTQKAKTNLLNKS